jgi:hypothetical protein
VTDAVVLPLGPGGHRLLGVLAAAGVSRPLAGLAEALARSDPAATMPDVVLAVRSAPRPLLVFAGSTDAAQRARLDVLPGLIDEAATRLRILSWPDVEAACATLADRLAAVLGDDVDRAHVVGVPRGGTVVAGLVAYALGIPRERLHATADVGGSAGPLVLVDDGAISGLRLREAVRSLDAERVVVGLLCAHPDLPASLQRAEPAVVACVTALDLADHGAAILGEEEAAWRARWTERVPQRLVTRLLDLVVYPWSEPDVRLWNAVSGAVEGSWGLAPPEVCLRTRRRAPAIEVQHADALPGVARLAAAVVPVRQADGLDLVDADGGPGATLRGTAAALLLAWLADGRSATAGVAARYGVAEARVAADLDGLLGDLRGRGLLAAAQ